MSKWDPMDWVIVILAAGAAITMVVSAITGVGW